MRLGCFCILSVMAFFFGCEREELQPIPSAPETGNVLETPKSWQNLTNKTEVKKSVRMSDGAKKVNLSAPGVLVFPVDFSDPKSPPARATWDIKMPCDMKTAEGLEFDFYCEDLSQFTTFTCYFKSGNGWYSAPFATEEDGVWQKVLVRKSQCGTEDKPSGWGNVSAIRISGWRAGHGKTRLAIANMRVVQPQKPDVAIICSESHFAGLVSSSLKAVGIESVLIDDKDLNDSMLNDISAVILPYNPNVTPNAISCVRKFVAAGGRILACYSQPKEIFNLLGVKSTGTKRPTEASGGVIAGFLKADSPIASQPAYVPQASWMTHVPVRTKGVEICAVWANGKQKSLGLPALVRTKSGLYMSHVWLGGTSGAQADMMRAIAQDLSPSLKSKIDAKSAEAKRRENEARAWLAMRPSKPGEHRAVWCHSARGLGGGRSWDESIKFLKECGFNAIHPNLAWGGVAYYDSKVLPVSPDVKTAGDALVQCRKACRKYGVEMHVWKVCWNMGEGASDEFVAKMVKEGRVQVDAKGKKYERWMCPSDPGNQQLEINAMVELAQKGVDGIHFDYIRYPGVDRCFCKACKMRFELKLGHTITNWPGDVRGDKARYKREWRDFRVANITKVVKTVSERVRAIAPGIEISAALFKNPVTDPETVAQDWVQWCKAGYLDFACHMDYIESPAMLRSQVKLQKESCGNVKLYPGIGLSCWTNDGDDAVRLAKQIQVVRDLGLDGFTVFNFDRRAEKALPLMRLGVTRDD